MNGVAGGSCRRTIRLARFDAAKAVWIDVASFDDGRMGDEVHRSSETPRVWLFPEADPPGVTVVFRRDDGVFKFWRR